MLLISIKAILVQLGSLPTPWVSFAHKEIISTGSHHCLLYQICAWAEVYLS